MPNVNRDLHVVSKFAYTIVQHFLRARKRKMFTKNSVVNFASLNYFSAKLANFQFDIQTAATNTEVLAGTGALNLKVKESEKEAVSYENRFTAAA